MFARVTDWFIPSDSFANRTDHERASVFVFTHVFGPFLAQPMWVFLMLVSPEFDPSILVLVAATACFWSLPFLLKYTGRMFLATMLSFQLLAMTTLFASHHYGGFTSPFMPWLVVSLLLGLFYHNRNVPTVLAAFGLNLLFWVLAIDFGQVETAIDARQLEILGALSLASATIYVTWMAHYYSRIVELRAELEEEADRCQAVYAELTEARVRSETAITVRARFFSKISHELRTPLNAIIGYAELLIEDLRADGDKDDQRGKDLSRIMAAARHLMSLFSQILDVKSIEERRERLDVTDFKVGDLCDEVVATSAHLIEKNRNRLVVVCNCRSRELSTDVTRLRQILLNLLSNAAKFTSDGVVKLEFDFIGQSSGAILRAAVIDTGIGMSEQGLSKIFTDYEQAEEDTTQNYGGTGIGLPLSRHLCHLLGGEITATSRKGEGSSFTAWIPATYCGTNTRASGARDRSEDPATDSHAHPDRLSDAQGKAA